MPIERVSAVELDPAAIELLPMRSLRALREATTIVGKSAYVRRVSDLLGDDCAHVESLADAGLRGGRIVLLVEPNRRERDLALSKLRDAEGQSAELTEWLPCVDVERAIEASTSYRSALAGVRVLITRARSQAASTAAMLRARGAVPIAIPTIALHPPTDPAPLAEAAAHLDRYAVVALTSANGVDALLAAVHAHGLDARAFASCRIATIGPGTSDALTRHGLRADVMAVEHRGEGLATAILEDLAARGSARGRRVLLARAEVARDALPDALASAGVELDVVAAYRTEADHAAKVALRQALGEREVDAVLFTASSTVTSFCDALDDAPTQLAGVCIASIGPITTATAARRGLSANVEASPYTLPALLDALDAYFASRAPRKA
jgi:uroporphyrinogen-III synthase